jgi:hypothetical protein
VRGLTTLQAIAGLETAGVSKPRTSVMPAKGQEQRGNRNRADRRLRTRPLSAGRPRCAISIRHECASVDIAVIEAGLPVKEPMPRRRCYRQPNSIGARRPLPAAATSAAGSPAFPVATEVRHLLTGGLSSVGGIRAADIRARADSWSRFLPSSAPPQPAMGMQRRAPWREDMGQVLTVSRIALRW